MLDTSEGRVTTNATMVFKTKSSASTPAIKAGDNIGTKNARLKGFRDAPERSKGIHL